jgi:predicted transcriptional regulator
MRQKSKTLTDQELEIMKVIWGLRSATVRQVYEVLLEDRQIAYTTVMTMMGILEHKGYLTRRLEGRAYLYEPVQAKSQVISGMVQEFLDRLFNGSARPLLVSLAEEQKITEEDLELLSRHLDGNEESEESP